MSITFYLAAIGKELLEVVILKDGEHLGICTSRCQASYFPQTLEEVEADEGMTSFNLQLALDGLNVLKILFKNAGDF